MTILITGGAGFVGLNLAEQCLQQGQNVVLFGPVPAKAHEYLSEFDGVESRLRLVQGDVRVSAELDAAIVSNQVTRIVHGAAITADIHREKTSARTIVDVNLGGTIEVLEAALRHGIDRVIQLGTGSIFGSAGNVQGQLDEVSSVVVPDSLYGISKYAAERTAVRYRHTRGLAVTVLRLGMVFGRWEYASGLRDTLSFPSQLAALARAGGHVVLHVDAGNDWVYADDVARGIINALTAPTLPEPVYHLSAGQAWSVPDWCFLLKQRYAGFTYEFSQNLDDCTVGRNKPAKRAIFNIDRLTRDTTYRPQFLLNEAFKSYMDWNEAHT